MYNDDLHSWPGLTDEEAVKRLTKDGYNELPSQKKQSLLSIFLRIIFEPMILLLIGCGTIYLLIGEPKDAAMLLSSVILVVFITFYQERKTENTLQKLKNLSSPRAYVIRSGQRKRIPGKDVVRGDILLLQEGDRVPADAIVYSCSNLMTDESLLTGESMPVRKTSWDGKIKYKRAGGDDLPFIFSGSLVVSGHGIAEVTQTGIKTEMGKIGISIQTIKEEDTLLHKDTQKIVKFFSIYGFILCILMVLLYFLTKGDLLNGILAGLTLSMSLLPEEFPVVLLIFLTLGAWRISKKHVLTRKPAAIETLGAATVLCVDKTGTLTLNKMRMMQIFTDNTSFNLDKLSNSKLPEKYHELLEYSFLASQKDPFDPIEKEIKKVCKENLNNTKHIHDNWKIVKEYPLSKKMLALSHVWSSPNNEEFVISAKGAPETIVELCHIEKNKKEKILKEVYDMANTGLRVLGVAKASFPNNNLPDKLHDYNFDFIGLLGFVDPVRQTVPEALNEAYEAGIRVIMITGDYPGTAVFVAKKIGLKNPENYILGSEIESLDKNKLAEKISNINIFARVVPEQKLAIVNALKNKGEIVAMTGDGINDAPALKSAHIGIAMGERGTDVAREAASLVLLDDDFSSIVSAVRLGRRIFSNLRKAMGYVFSIHVPIVGMSFLPILFGFPIVLLPAHIAFLELIIDPACSTVFESQPEDKDIMKRLPRNLNDPLFNKKTIITSLLQGFGILIVVFGFYLLMLSQGKNDLEVRSITFSILVFANLFLIITNLSRSRNIFYIIKTPNKPLWIVILLTSCSLIIILYNPILRDLFHFGTLKINEFIFAFFAGILALFWFEFTKIINNKYINY